MGTRTSYEHGVFSWVDLASKEIDGATTFYEQLFDWTAEPQDTGGGYPYTMFQLKGHHVAGLGQLSEEMKDAGVPATWNTYVQVRNADEAHARALKAGAEAVTPVMDAMDAGRMAFLKDPEGAQFAIWETKSHPGAGLVNDPGCFIWNELATRQPEEAMRFYGEVFGWSFQPMEDDPNVSYQLIQVGGRAIGGILTMNEQWGDIPAAWNVYFNVADIQDAIGRVETAGGKVLQPPIETPVGPISVVADRDGAHFSLLQAKIAEA